MIAPIFEDGQLYANNIKKNRKVFNFTWICRENGIFAVNF